MKKIVLIALLLCFVSVFGWGQTTRDVYYDTDLATGSHNGTSWPNAYADLQTAETAEDGDISASTGSNEVVIFHCRSTGGNAETGVVSVAGWTTAATNYILFETASTDRADANGWDAAKCRLTVTDNPCFSITEDYVRIDGFQLQIIYSAVSGKSAIYTAGQTASTNDLRFSNNRILGDTNAASNSNGITTGSVNTIAKIWNNIIYNCDDRGIWADDSATMDIYNNTIYNCTFRGIDQDSGTVKVYNTAVLDTGDDFSGTFDTIDYCASDDNDTTNVNVAESGGGAGWPNDFEGASTGDFRLKSGSNLIGATSDKSGGLFTDDIEGTTRGASWDVGAFEYVAAGGGSIVPILAEDRRRWYVPMLWFVLAVWASVVIRISNKL